MKLKEKNTRKLIRWGKTSLGITLPMDIIDELNWREKQKLTVKRVSGGILIRDWRSPRKNKKK